MSGADGRTRRALCDTNDSLSAPVGGVCSNTEYNSRHTAENYEKRRGATSEPLSNKWYPHIFLNSSSNFLSSIIFSRFSHFLTYLVFSFTFFQNCQREARHPAALVLAQALAKTSLVSTTNSCEKEAGRGNVRVCAYTATSETTVSSCVGLRS